MNQDHRHAALGVIAAGLATCSQRWNEPDLAQRSTWEFSSRMTTSLGRCYPKRRLVRLHAGLVAPGVSEFLREVVAHEAAHIVAYERHGRRAGPHGTEWAELVRIAGYPARTSIEMPLGWTRKRPKGGSKQRTLVAHCCMTCGTTLTANAPRAKWKCPECLDIGVPSRIDIVQVPR